MYNCTYCEEKVLICTYCEEKVPRCTYCEEKVLRFTYCEEKALRCSYCEVQSHLIYMNVADLILSRSKFANSDTDPKLKKKLKT